MEKSIKIMGLRVLTLALFVLSLFSSCKKEDQIPLLKPTIVSVSVEKIGVNTASVVINFIPNEETQIYLEMNNLKQQSLPEIYNGKDLVEISVDLPNLERNTEYSLRIKAANIAGDVASENVTFKTFAAEDFDGNLYRSVLIGEQEWLTENLRTTHFSNGDPIQFVGLDDWGFGETPAYCWYNNEQSLKTYGALYNWYNSVDSRGLIEGWHVPSHEECIILDSLLGGPIVAGPKLTSLDYWIDLVVPANNESGFGAVPSGVLSLDSISGNFVFSGLREIFSSWTSSASPKTGHAWCAVIRNDFVVAELQQQSVKNGYSFRLVKNKK